MMALDWQSQALRLWLFFTAILSLVDFYKCYRSIAGQAHIKATYPNAPWQETSRLAARQLGMSHLLLVLIRIYAGMYFTDPAAFRVCHLSFVIVFFHFIGNCIDLGLVDTRSYQCLIEESRGIPTSFVIVQ
ncbi:hypothetical protein AMS68_003739 [Peltaster fructicola]|uniref:Uncharacterized protein n=1 Tax=Peltaster fructicola TaxID=286661 RepID=A0A6H0XTX1_9PEZI|nr:hypothetical protein AMS68_003739 [Peltaster fructicola]